MGTCDSTQSRIGSICAEHEQQPPRVCIRPAQRVRYVSATASAPLPGLRHMSLDSSSSGSSPSPSPSPHKKREGKHKKHHGSASARHSVSTSPRDESSGPGHSTGRRHRSQKGRGAESCTVLAFPTSEPQSWDGVTAKQAFPTSEPQSSDGVTAKQVSRVSRESSVGFLTSRSLIDFHETPCPLTPLHRTQTRRPTPYYSTEYLESEPEVGVEASLPSMAWLQKHLPSPSLQPDYLAAAGA